MKISRRQFVGDALVSVSGLCLLGPRRLAGDCSWSVREDGCVVLDLGAQCALAESLQGFAAVLGENNICAAEERRDWRRDCRLAIVPGVGSVDERIAAALADLLETGTAVLLESGAGFCERSEFAAHQRVLRRFFAVEVEEPADVRCGSTPGPYVHYEWPSKAIVRDFSRVVPVVAGETEVIGQIGELAVASKKRVGKGQLVFIGSPLGPVLRAGDFEACDWLRSLSFQYSRMRIERCEPINSCGS